MKKVIVCGGAGFIGRQSLNPLLESGYEVHAIDLNLLANEYSDVIWHKVNLFEFKQVEKLFTEIKADYLLNFAWFTSHAKYWSSPENFNSVKLSLKLFEEFVKNGGKRIVMAGTCAEYYWNNELCSEKYSLMRPSTIYGQCKLAIFNLLKAFAQLHGISWAWGRLFFLFGPYENKNRFVASIINSILDGKRPKCSHGRQIRDFMSTVDAGSAFAKLLVSKVNGAVNIASGNPVSLKEIGKNIERLLGTRNKIDFGAIKASKSEPDKIVADIGRLTSEVGWKPTVTIEKRLEDTISWWRKGID